MPSHALGARLGANSGSVMASRGGGFTERAMLSFTAMEEFVFAAAALPGLAVLSLWIAVTVQDRIRAGQRLRNSAARSSIGAS